MPIRTLPASVIVLALTTLPAYSQVVSGATFTPSTASLTIEMLPSVQRNMLLSEPPRTGAPYCARVKGTSSQIQPDGSKGPVTGSVRYVDEDNLMCRDSMGRVRNEHPLAFMQLPSFRIVSIDDPVGGYRYFLDTVNHVAHRMAMPAGHPAPGALSNDRPMPQSVGSTSSPGPGITTAVEPLGPEELFGVKILGRRTTTIYGPESQTGKDHPVTTVSEMWRAPALGIVVSVRSLNPAGVEHVSTTTDLKATEPDSALFQVPTGYKIEDETSPFTIQIPR